MSQGKQAKILNEAQIKAVLHHIESSRYPARDRVMVLLSVKAGLRAKEISLLTWGMVTDATGALGDAIHLPNVASKGKAVLRDALAVLQATRGALAAADRPVIHSERSSGLSAATVVNWFGALYGTLGFNGASSHSGRRTFITKAAKKLGEAGGSLRDIQELAGHSSLATTQRYIQGDTDAKRKLMTLI
jgi:integrase/recombinase XerD